MRKSRNNVSRYIDEMYLPKIKQSGNGVSPALFLLSVFSALFIFVLAAQPLVAGLLNKNTGGNSANAMGIACSPILGTGMDNKTGWASDGVGDYPLPDKTGRTWTVQEVLGSGITLVNYDGEGNGGTLVRDKETPTTDNYKKYAAQYKEKLEAERTLGNCWGGVLTRMANAGFGISNLITGLAKFFASTAFSTELICADPAKPTGNCFNLGKIIGGTGSSSGGIIGALTASIYLPLLVIAVTFAACWIGYIGFVKRKIREALFGLIWVIAAVVVGLALLLNPSILAKAPIAFSNAVSTCVIGAFNGENCMSGSKTGAALDYKTGDKTSDRVCISDVNSASISQSMLLKTNAITCSIWKAFVLEPLSQSAFGMNFEDLDANTGAIAENVKAAGLKGDDFCIDLYSSKSYNQMKNDTLVLERSGNKKICNVMTYQMYLQVAAVSQSDQVKEVGKLPQNGSLDDRWYKVVAVAAANDNTWSYWAKNSGNFFMPMLAMLTSALGTFIIVVTAIFALVYYIGSVILMAFAPIFFLFAIHPGRGKKIFLGWIEKIVSNLLKYLLSAVFLVATLAIYGAVLNDMSNIGMTLLFVIIVTMALFMYRNELMGLLGRANMGGEQLSSAMSNSLGGMAKGAGSLAKGQIGKFAGHGTQGLAGAAGSLYAAKGSSFSEKMDATKAGFKDGAKRSIRRSGGVLGHAVAQYERASTDNKNDLRNKQGVFQENSIDAENDSVIAQKELATAESSLNSAIDEEKDNKARLDHTSDHLAQYRQAEKETTEEMVTTSALETKRQIQEIEDDPTLSAAEKQEKIAAIKAEHNLIIDFAKFQNLSNALNDAKMDLHIAEMTGDTAAAEIARNTIAELTPEKNALYAALGAQNTARLRKDYQMTLSENLNNDGVDNFTKEDFNSYVQLSVAVSKDEARIAAATQNRDLRLAENELAMAEAKRSKLMFESLEEQNNALRPGESVTDAKRDEMLRVAGEAADQAGVGEARMEELREKVNRLKGEGEIPEVDSPFVAPVVGRSSVDADARSDDDNDLHLNGAGNAEPGQYNAPNPSAEDIGYTDADAPDIDEPMSESYDNSDNPVSGNNNGPSGSNRRPDFAENEQRAADEEEYINSLNAERASASGANTTAIPTSNNRPQFKKDKELFDAEEAMNNEGFQQRGQQEEQELYRTSESTRNEALRGDFSRRDKEHEKAFENAAKEQQRRSEGSSNETSSVNFNNGSGNNGGQTSSSASSDSGSGRNPFIDDEPPLTPEEEAMVQKDNKTDRKEAMRRKSSEARARRSAENSNGEQLIWDSMEEQARIEQEEAMEESRYEAPAKPVRRSGIPRTPTPSSNGFGRSVNDPTAKRPADLGGNAFSNKPENPLQGRGRNEGRRGRVMPTVDPQNMFDEDDDE